MGDEAQATLAASASTQRPSTTHSRMAQPMAERSLRSIAWAVRSDTPHSRATACAEAPRASEQTMKAARNHFVSGTLVCAIAVPLVAENCHPHPSQRNSLRPETRA